MSIFTTINILDMIDAIGEDDVKSLLSDFVCPINKEIVGFIIRDAIIFARKKSSMTHLVVNEEGNLVAFFTLTHKAIWVHDSALSAKLRKKVERYAKLDETTNSYLISAFLIAQFSKNLAMVSGSTISGNALMDAAMDVLTSVQHEVGGGLVYLECEDIPKLLSFYQNENNCFRIFGERFSTKDKTKYIQLLRFF